jgi:hypothetical protein
MKVNIEFRLLKMHEIAITKLCRPRELLRKKLALLEKHPHALKCAKRLKIAPLQRGNPGLSNCIFKNKIKQELVGKKLMFTL